MKDLQRSIRTREQALVLAETRDQANLTPEVLNRQKVPSGAHGYAVPTYGGGMVVLTRERHEAVVMTRLSVVGTDYQTDIVRGARLWSSAADDVVRVVEQWVKENYNSLVKNADKK